MPNTIIRHLILLAASLLVVACTPSAPRTLDPAEAQRATESISTYLEAVAGSASDRGWSMLHADHQRRYPGGEAGYIRDARAAEWTRFEWEVVDVRQDDRIYCAHLSLPNGPNSVPAFLKDTRSGVMSFVAVPTARPPGTEALVCVSMAIDGRGQGIVGG